MTLPVESHKLVGTVVLRIARKLIEQDCNLLSGTSKNTSKMFISPDKRIADTEWEKRVDCVRLLAFYLSDSDSPESEGDYGDEVAALLVRYIDMAEKRVKHALINLASPIVQDEDKVE